MFSENFYRDHLKTDSRLCFLFLATACVVPRMSYVFRDFDSIIPPHQGSGVGIAINVGEWVSG